MRNALIYTGRPFGVAVLERGDCAYAPQVPHAFSFEASASSTYSANPFYLFRSASGRGGVSSLLDPSLVNALRHS